MNQYGQNPSQGSPVQVAWNQPQVNQGGPGNQQPVQGNVQSAQSQSDDASKLKEGIASAILAAEKKDWFKKRFPLWILGIIAAGILLVILVPIISGFAGLISKNVREIAGWIQRANVNPFDQRGFKSFACLGILLFVLIGAICGILNLTKNDKKPKNN